MSDCKITHMEKEELEKYLHDRWGDTETNKIRIMPRTRELSGGEYNARQV